MILSQTDGTNNWYFQYDNNGTPLGFVLNGTQYFYITNQMNDVLAITDTTGTIVGNYEYDAWGKVLTADTSIAQQNPLRYRGYYYDNETGYYYLQSRYYDPSICRFINSDVAEFSLILKNIVSGTNLFAYCNNDPVNNSDPTGLAKINIKWIDWTIDLLLIILPMVGQINSALAKAGKPSSKIISKISSLFKKYYGKINGLLLKATKKIFNKNLATKITSIVCSGLFKALAMISIFSSLGNFIEYIIDCLDGKWDGYLDTSVKLRIRIIWAKGY